MPPANGYPLVLPPSSGSSFIVPVFPALDQTLLSELVENVCKALMIRHDLAHLVLDDRLSGYHVGAAFQDAGIAIHPSYVEGQIQGGTSQGLGWALNEEYFFNDNSQMQNTSYLDYRMPISTDLPMIDAQLVEVPNPGHPTGVRGVGEVSIIPPVPAVANAIYNAIGVRMNTLPMSPGAVLEALWETGRGIDESLLNYQAKVSI